MSKEKISWKQKEQIIFICEILLFVIGSVLFLVSRVGNLFNLGLVAIMILFCMNILFSIKNFKENFLYFFMQLTLFTFQMVGRKFSERGKYLVCINFDCYYRDCALYWC